MISKNQIKDVKALHLKKFRDEQECFIAEGVKGVDEIILYRSSIIKELFCTRDYLDRRQDKFNAHNIEYTVVSEDELKKISMQPSPNQVLAVCAYLKSETKLPDFKTTFSLYLDEIRDPGNLGTILRIADWFGAGHVFCSPTSTDLYNPKTIQSAMGAFLRVNVSYIELSDLLKTNSFPLYGAVLNGKPVYTEKLKPGLIVIGNEANGIAASNLKLITNPITIPAHSASQTESLNAAMATAIICSEFFRQLY
ncbi:MAG: TrmH family RNA methyltransferase [Bacteroidia bacterium]